MIKGSISLLCIVFLGTSAAYRLSFYVIAICCRLIKFDTPVTLLKKRFTGLPLPSHFSCVPFVPVIKYDWFVSLLCHIYCCKPILEFNRAPGSTVCASLLLRCFLFLNLGASIWSSSSCGKVAAKLPLSLDFLIAFLCRLFAAIYLI